MRKAITGLMTGMMLVSGVAAPALAGDRDHSSRKEVRESRRDVREERRDYRKALRKGDRDDVREERRELRDAQRELRQDRRDLHRQQQRDWQTYRNYDWNRPDPSYGRYYAERYYRDGSYYQPRTLGYNDRIYRGSDGRYYCRRPDGTTGLIIGALGGGVLGNIIAPGGSKTLGSVIGAGVGALIGREIERGQVRCR